MDKVPKANYLISEALETLSELYYHSRLSYLQTLVKNFKWHPYHILSSSKVKVQSVFLFSSFMHNKDTGA